MGELKLLREADSRHTAQACYCGEYNCVGFIGGKTQTDVGGMDDLLLDALGILDDVTAGGMKGSKKKKSRQLDVDYNVSLTPVQKLTPAGLAAHPATRSTQGVGSDSAVA